MLICYKTKPITVFQDLKLRWYTTWFKIVFLNFFNILGRAAVKMKYILWRCSKRSRNREGLSTHKEVVGFWIPWQLPKEWLSTWQETEILLQPMEG